mmetsp:Transcript_16422/g.57300  ORF Transcript_16422/g.57300 Transcript_16422/m.57300 type:complete len:247 (+) Transcript_16422:291-1031(+)
MSTAPPSVAATLPRRSAPRPRWSAAPAPTEAPPPYTATFSATTAFATPTVDAWSRASPPPRTAALRSMRVPPNTASLAVAPVATAPPSSPAVLCASVDASIEARQPAARKSAPPSPAAWHAATEVCRSTTVPPKKTVAMAPPVPAVQPTKLDRKSVAPLSARSERPPPLPVDAEHLMKSTESKSPPVPTPSDSMWKPPPMPVAETHPAKVESDAVAELPRNSAPPPLVTAVQFSNALRPSRTTAPK